MLDVTIQDEDDDSNERFTAPKTGSLIFAPSGGQIRLCQLTPEKQFDRGGKCKKEKKPTIN